MKIPNTIHFMGHDYSVVEVARLDDGASLGSTNEDHLEIKIEKYAPPTTKEETLLHEIMHIAYFHTFREYSDEKQEKIVKVWSKNLYGILKDNNLLRED